MNRKTLPVVFATALLGATVAFADELPSAKPESVGLSTARPERIATAVQRAVDSHRVAGAVTLVVRHGQVAWFKAQGMKDTYFFLLDDKVSRWQPPTRTTTAKD